MVICNIQSYDLYKSLLQNIVFIVRQIFTYILIKLQPIIDKMQIAASVKETKLKYYTRRKIIKETHNLALHSVPHIVAQFEDVTTNDEPDYLPVTRCERCSVSRHCTVSVLINLLHTNCHPQETLLFRNYLCRQAVFCIQKR